MKSFNEFIIERAGVGLTIFDIDETMFVTKAKVKVIKDGKTIKSLDNKQFNKYKLNKDEDMPNIEDIAFYPYKPSKRPLPEGSIGKVYKVFFCIRLFLAIIAIF